MEPLLVLISTQDGDVININNNEATIGKNENNDFVLTNDDRIADLQATFKFEEDYWILEDNSGNGM